MTPVYEATVTLMLSESKIGEEPALPASVPTFRALIQSRSVAGDALTELGLTEPPYNLNPVGFVNGALDVQQVGDTNLIQATVRLPDPELAARVANRIAEGGVELNRRLNQQDTVDTRDFIREQLDQARTRLETVEAELTDFRREARIEILSQQVDTLLSRAGTLENQVFDIEQSMERQRRDAAAERLAEAREALLEYQRTAQLSRAERMLALALEQNAQLQQERTDLAIDIETQQARLAQAQEEIGSQPNVLEMTRSIDNEPALMETARSRDRDQNLLGLSLRNEFLNPMFQTLEDTIVTTRTSLAGLRTRLQEVQEEVTATSERLEELQVEVAEKTAELERRRQEFNLARDEYLRLLETSPSSYEARLSVVSDSRAETLEELRERQNELYRREVQLDDLETERTSPGRPTPTWRGSTSRPGYRSPRGAPSSRSSTRRCRRNSPPPRGCC